MNNSEKQQFIEDYVRDRAKYLYSTYNISFNDDNISHIIDLFNESKITSQDEKETLDRLISYEVEKVYRLSDKKYVVNNQYGSVILLYLISGIVVIGFILLFIYFLNI